jgi:hypothetical protein
MGRWGGHPAMAQYAPFTDAMLYTESDAGGGESDAEALEGVTTEQA